MAGKGWVHVDNLVTAEDIAVRLLGSAKRATTVNLWKSRNADFPKPIKASARAIIWDWADVEAWAKATGRLDAKGQPVRPSTDPTRKRKRQEGTGAA
jgi:predicted DNA-binding transcriptional regulator AlpA